jgi:hypothetical protein
MEVIMDGSALHSCEKGSFPGLCSLFVGLLMFPALAMSQGTNTALLRGMVVDPTQAAVPGVKVSIMDISTGVVTQTTTDAVGRYIFNEVKPATYTVRATATGFKTYIRENVVLLVGQQTDVDITLVIGQSKETVEVTAAAPLLNTVSGALGTTLTNEMINDLPLSGLDITSLSYFSPSVTEVTGSGIDTLGGTNFVSNGQRNATAEFRWDGALLSHPEGGEGATTIVNYLPIPDAIAEFNLQNNSFSAEHGSNGGTIVNIVTKSGTNQFHGSGFYLYQRPWLNANDFFSNLGGVPKGQFTYDQYGGSIGGPIRRNKTFFFFDYERIRNITPTTFVTTVPTLLQRQGDFSQTYNADGTLQQIFNPYDVSCTTSQGVQNCIRQPFANNVIPPGMINPVMQKVINLYPLPTGSGQPGTAINNYIQKVEDTGPWYQYDIRIDQDFSQKSRLWGRYSVARNPTYTPDPFLAPQTSDYNTDQVSLEHIWNPNANLLWTNRVGLVRWVNPQKVLPTVNPLSLGFPSELIDNPWYDQTNFPDISVANYQGLVTDACCTNTLETDTQWMFDSTVTKVKGGHNIRFGGEKRIFLNNFVQPGDSSGGLTFGQDVTQQNVFLPNTDLGNGMASLLLGWGDSGGASGVGEVPAVANRSAETSFFVQDDWKVTRRLTLNLGLRYEWSTPYTERFNRAQFTCLNCDTGINVPSVPGLTGIWPANGMEIYGTNILATPGHRSPGTQYDHFAPRLGFAYELTPNTVLRGGAGVYYGMNYATNWQYGGQNWQGGANINFSLDGNITQYATIANPFPAGFLLPEERQYGNLAQWGYSDSNHQGLQNVNADIYMWNIGIQRQLGTTMLEVNYSASRSTHLPWNYSPANYNYIADAPREQYGSNGLYQTVPNPFYYLFSGSSPMFNQPPSIYAQPTVQLINLLRPYPQFPGSFTGFPPFAANAFYNALQVRFEKRASRGLTFLGNYTYSHFISDSDEGGNAWIGNLEAGEPQDLNNLAAEKSISANDTPNRLVFAMVYELPIGQGKAYGNHMGRVANGFLGGWRVSPWITFQTGQPIDISDSYGALADGSQRPNFSGGDPCTGASNYAIINGNPGADYFNVNAFTHAADQTPGNSPRYFSNCRVPGIHNLDLSFAKKVNFTENKFLEVRAEFFNFMNTPRFSVPGTSFGSPSFGIIGGQQNYPRGGQLYARFIF